MITVIVVQEITNLDFPPKPLCIYLKNNYFQFFSVWNSLVFYIPIAQTSAHYLYWYRSCLHLIIHFGKTREWSEVENHFLVAQKTKYQTQTWPISISVFGRSLSYKNGILVGNSNVIIFLFNQDCIIVQMLLQAHLQLAVTG